MKGLFVVLLCAMAGVKGSALPALFTTQSHVVRQSGAKPVVGSHLQNLGGLINQQSGVNPFLQGHQQHQTPSGGLPNQQLGLIKPVISHYQTPNRPNNQQLGVKPVDSHLHGPVSIVSKNSQANPEGSHNQKPIEIINQNSEVNPDGSYYNVWESENGIKVQEEGTVKVNGEDEIQSVRGLISYTGADGTPIHLTYVADENGFQPQGDHLPTPPPLPLSVARALEYIAAHPYVEKEHNKVYKPTVFKPTLVKEELPIVEVA